MTPAKARILKTGVATAIGVAILIGLGSWQLSRLAWKEALVAHVTERMAQPPAPVPMQTEWPTLDIGQWSYRKVRAEGAFDHAKEARVYVNLSEAHGHYRGPGYFILTPLALKAGGVVLVNRGFVPEQAADPATRPDSQPPGDVAVVGPLREPEAKNAFTPDDAAEKRLFFARDPAAIARGLGLAAAAPFTIDADATPNPGGLPQGGETRVTFPNRHLEYALTWYGLAGALIAVFFAFAWRTLNESADAEHPDRDASAPLSPRGRG